MRTTTILAADQLELAAELLTAGGLVAFPTETVYGLGANALDPAAVAAVFTAKGRPSDDPLIVHLAESADLLRVAVDLPALAHQLAKAFWPGPLTLILPRHPALPASVSAGLPHVAVRVPLHPLARRLIGLAGVPLVAPSANRFGHTSPTTAAHVFGDLAGQIDAIIDGGATPLGIESTVLDLSGPAPRLLRPGAISLETLEAQIGPIAVAERTVGPTASPGLLERHYAPDAEMTLFAGERGAALAAIHAALNASSTRCGLLLCDEDLAEVAHTDALSVSLGPLADPAQIAQRLYAALRELDATEPTKIFSRDLGSAGLYRAISDRLRRAAAGRMVRV